MERLGKETSHCRRAGILASFIVVFGKYRGLKLVEEDRGPTCES